MRTFSLMVVTVGLLGIVASSQAEQPAAPAAPVMPAVPVAELVPLEKLVELGAAVAAIRYESDNVFRYTERSVELRNAAETLKGGQLEFTAKVMRVYESEVFIEIEPAGKTRIVLMHPVPPTFGNLRTVEYGGVRSTSRFHLFSAPVGLRIGSEIPFEVAKKLRQRDRLVMRGMIDCAPVWIESVFSPDVVVLISDWAVVDVNPEPSY